MKRGRREREGGREERERMSEKIDVTMHAKQMKALKYKALVAELAHAYTLHYILCAFYADNHFSNLNAHR